METQIKVFGEFLDSAQIAALDSRDRFIYEENLKIYRDNENAADYLRAEGEAKGKAEGKAELLIKLKENGFSILEIVQMLKMIEAEVLELLKYKA
jgi:predicted transposase/invertase (TIGR01784 family)